MSLESEITKEINKLLPHYIKILQNLIQYNSVYGNEKDIQLFIKKKMEELGLEPKIYYSRNDKESINLVAVKNGIKKDYNSLVLNAHCDVTPVEDESSWDYPPFSGKIIDGKIYGRGSQDDKAGISIMLLIYHVIKNLGIELNGDLILESVIEDETTGNGTKCLVNNGYEADGVIIIDGTWSERIIYAHLSQLWINFDIIGESVAACVEERGINPIYIATSLIEELKGWINELNKEVKDFEGIEKPFFINVGSFHSGVWAGSVPENTKIEVQIGFNDMFSIDEIFKQVRNIALKLSDRITVSKGLLQAPYFIGNKKSTLINSLKDIIEKNSNKEVLTVPVTGHCDMKHFGISNVCLYGPGGGKNAHSNNEFYILEQMPLVAKNIIDFILGWCNEKRN